MVPSYTGTARRQLSLSIVVGIFERQHLVWIVSIFAVALVALVAWLWTPDASRASVEARHLDSPSDYLYVGGQRLHVRDAGSKDAPALIMLHGAGSSLHTWESCALSLSSAYRVVRYDLPGCGLTGPDVTGDYSEARGMQILLGLMNELSIERASLMGNSMGGRLAWRFAARHPERIEKLVLISPDGFERPGHGYGRAPVLPPFVKLTKYALPKALLRRQLALSYGDRRKLNEETVARYHDLIRSSGVRPSMISRAEQTVLDDPTPFLKNIGAPTLIVWGELDALIPSSYAGRFLDALPNATLVTLPGLGHMPHEEDAGTLLEPVRAFLRR